MLLRPREATNHHLGHLTFPFDQGIDLSSMLHVMVHKNLQVQVTSQHFNLRCHHKKLQPHQPTMREIAVQNYSFPSQLVDRWGGPIHIGGSKADIIIAPIINKYKYNVGGIPVH